MVLNRPEEYLSRLKSRTKNLLVYAAGERVDPLTSPVTLPVIKVIEKTYELALKDEYKDILVTKGLNGDDINRFVHVEKSQDDLIKRVESQRLVSFYVGNCNYRCTGHDGINALYATTYEIDNEFGTEYHKRFLEYLKYVQNEDLVVTTAMTDVKGNRAKRPAEAIKTNPLSYVRVVEERKDGIIVSGAKMHISGAAVADEILVVPTRSLKEDEKEFAVAFAAKPEYKGIYFVSGWNSYDSLKRISQELGIEIDYPTPYGHRNTFLIIFDEVFIPKERVFMLGEAKYAGKLVEYFVAHHRAAGAGCKAAFADVMLGTAALAAEVNGVLDARYIQDKLLDIKRHGEAAYAAGIAAMAKGWKHPSGAYIPDIKLANIAKLEAIEHIKEAVMAAAEIGGGIAVNAPSAKDLGIKEIGDKVSKAIEANEKYNALDRLKVMRFLALWTAGPHLVGLVQGGGPPATQLLALKRILKDELPVIIDNVKKLIDLKE